VRELDCLGPVALLPECGLRRFPFDSLLFLSQVFLGVRILVGQLLVGRIYKISRLSFGKSNFFTHRWGEPLG
jgi:hypothetical protein